MVPDCLGVVNDGEGSSSDDISSTSSRTKVGFSLAFARRL
jgi:hypothetical protein